jgi:hypothetical protein
MSTAGPLARGGSWSTISTVSKMDAYSVESIEWEKGVKAER